MATLNPQSAKTHVNVMEALVYKEIEKQLKFYPKNLKSYFNEVEVATHALNRLPPLYASSLSGQKQQERLGQQKHKEEIVSAVRRAIAAVERDPLRNSTPIVSEMEMQYEEALQTLKAIQEILDTNGLLDYVGQELNWENCTRVLQKAFQKVMSSSSSRSASSRISSSRPSPTPPPLPANPRAKVNDATLW